MFGQYSRLTSVARGAVLAALTLALAGCGEEPTAPRLIGFSPAVLTVPGGEAIAISVEYEENDFALQDFQWTAAAGEIEGNGAPSITYHAPPDPGDYKIAVSVAYGDDATALSLDSVIKVTEPVVAPPAVSEAIEPETAPASPADQPATATAAAPAEPATTAESTAPAAVEAVEEAPVTGQAAEPPAAEEVATTAAAPEPAAPAAGPGAEETKTAAAATTEQVATAVAEGSERVAEAAEETAQATVAAVGEAVKETGAAAERAASDVAEITEEASGAVKETAPTSAAPTTGGTAPTGEPEPQVAALTREPAAASGSAGSKIDQILDKHRLTAVVQIAFQPFSYYGEDGRRTGFDVDMVREFARRWLDDPKAVTFLPVPTDARIPTLQKGRADLVAAALTKTPARAEEVDFSLTYFKDGQQLLVREDSGVADVCDLRGRKVAAIQGSTSLDNVKAAAGRCGFELGADLVTFRRHDDAVEALLGGQVEAFTSDGVALENIALGQPLKVVGNHFSEEPYGFAVPKGDQRLLVEVDQHLLAQIGKVARIINHREVRVKSPDCVLHAA
jgi:ABC-type amino acid transport substrate-binding protein